LFSLPACIQQPVVLSMFIFVSDYRLQWEEKYTQCIRGISGWMITRCSGWKGRHLSSNHRKPLCDWLHCFSLLSL
jgi:hypothetical protein